MKGREDVEAVVAGVDALLVAVLTVPAVFHFVAKTRLFKAHGYGSISGFYEDKDGEATEKSTQEYSDLPPRVAAWLSSALGLGAAVVAGVLLEDGESHPGFLGFLCGWEDVIAWVSPTRSGSTIESFC